MLTKKVILDGRVTDVKQCMPEDEVIIVETADFDDKGQAGPALLAKRSNWLFSVNMQIQDILHQMILC